MKRAILTVFLFGAALFGTSTLASAHPGHGGGPGHTHGHAHIHGLPHTHGGVIIYRSHFGSPYNSYYFGQPRIIRPLHLHGPHDHFHGHDQFHNHGGGMRFRTGGFSFGIRF